MQQLLHAEPFRPEHGRGLRLPGHPSALEGAVTIFAGGAVFAVVGAHSQGDATELWLILTDAAKARPHVLCRAARIFTYHMLLEHGRLIARVDTMPDRRFAEHLGFVFDNCIGILEA